MKFYHYAKLCIREKAVAAGPATFTNVVAGRGLVRRHRLDGLFHRWDSTGKERKQCAVHKKRTMTNKICKDCLKYLCSSECWERWHVLEDYRLD